MKRNFKGWMVLLSIIVLLAQTASFSALANGAVVGVLAPNGNIMHEVKVYGPNHEALDEPMAVADGTDITSILDEIAWQNGYESVTYISPEGLDSKSIRSSGSFILIPFVGIVPLLEVLPGPPISLLTIASGLNDGAYVNGLSLLNGNGQVIPIVSGMQLTFAEPYTIRLRYVFTDSAGIIPGQEYTVSLPPELIGRNSEKTPLLYGGNNLDYGEGWLTNDGVFHVVFSEIAVGSVMQFGFECTQWLSESITYTDVDSPWDFHMQIGNKDIEVKVYTETGVPGLSKSVLWDEHNKILNWTITLSPIVTNVWGGNNVTVPKSVKLSDVFGSENLAQYIYGQQYIEDSLRVNANLAENIGISVTYTRTNPQNDIQGFEMEIPAFSSPIVITYSTRPHDEDWDSFFSSAMEDKTVFFTDTASIIKVAGEDLDEPISVTAKASYKIDFIHKNVTSDTTGNTTTLIWSITIHSGVMTDALPDGSWIEDVIPAGVTFVIVKKGTQLLGLQETTEVDNPYYTLNENNDGSTTLKIIFPKGTSGIRQTYYLTVIIPEDMYYLRNEATIWTVEGKGPSSEKTWTGPIGEPIIDGLLNKTPLPTFDGQASTGKSAINTSTGELKWQITLTNPNPPTQEDAALKDVWLREYPMGVYRAGIIPEGPAHEFVSVKVISIDAYTAANNAMLKAALDSNGFISFIKGTETLNGSESISYADIPLGDVYVEVVLEITTQCDPLILLDYSTYIEYSLGYMSRMTFNNLVTYRQGQHGEPRYYSHAKIDFNNDMLLKTSLPRDLALYFFPNLAYNEVVWRIDASSDGGFPPLESWYSITDMLSGMTLSDHNDDYLLLYGGTQASQSLLSRTTPVYARGWNNISGKTFNLYWDISSLNAQNGNYRSVTINMTKSSNKRQLTVSMNEGFYGGAKFTLLFVARVDDDKFIEHDSTHGSITLNNQVVGNTPRFEQGSMVRDATYTMAYTYLHKDAVYNQEGIMEWQVVINPEKYAQFPPYEPNPDADNSTVQSARIIDWLYPFLDLMGEVELYGNSGPITNFTVSLLTGVPNPEIDPQTLFTKLVIEFDPQLLQGQTLTVRFKTRVLTTIGTKLPNHVWLEVNGYDTIKERSTAYTMQSASSGWITIGQYIQVLKRDKVSGAAMEGIEFKLYDSTTRELFPNIDYETDHPDNLLITDENGRLRVKLKEENSESTWYILQEVSNIPGFIPWNMTVQGIPRACLVYPIAAFNETEGWNLVENMPVTGEFIINKVDDQTRQILPGIQFKLLDEEDEQVAFTVNAAGTEYMVSAEGTTNIITTAAGTGVTVSGLRKGNYTLVETKSLPGYPGENGYLPGEEPKWSVSVDIVEEITAIVTIDALENTDAGWIWDDIFNELTIINIAIPVNRLTLLKVGLNAPSTGLTDVGFEVWTWETAPKALVFTQGYSGLYYYTSTGETPTLLFTGLNGRLSIRNLPNGAYTLKETVIPQGYDGVGDIYFTVQGSVITFTQGLPENVTWTEGIALLTVPNIPRATDFRVLKIDADVVPQIAIKDVVFTLTGLFDGDTVPASITKTTDSTGMVIWTGLKYGENYELRETAAPGYQPLPVGAKWNISVDAISGIITVTSENITLTDYEYIGNSLNLARTLKVFNHRLPAFGAFSVDKADKEITARKLPGAEFVMRNEDNELLHFVITAQASYVYSTDISHSTLLTTSDATTTMGRFNVAGIPLGTYKLYEITAPIGYEPVTELLVATIKVSYAPLAVNPAVVSLTPVSGVSIADNDTVLLTVYNKRENAYASFSLIKLDEDGTALEGAVFVLTGVPANGEPFTPIRGTTGSDGRLASPLLPEGVYTLTEESPPPGYTFIEGKKTWEVIVNQEGGVTIDNEVLSENMLDLTEIYKVYNHQVTGSFSIRKIDDETGTWLAGAVFELSGGSENIRRTGTTNERGIITFDNLPYGDYILRETRPPAGYRPTAQTWRVTVEMETGRLIYGGRSYSTLLITVRNVPAIPGEFSLLKTDFDTGNVLQGAAFRLVGGRPRIDETRTTDINGTLVFTGLSASTYVLTETQPPAGYTPNAMSWRIDVDYDGIVSINRIVNDGNPIIVTNKTLQPTGFAIHKVSSQTNEPLEGAEFTLTGPNGYERKVITDLDGNASFDEMWPGVYSLHETRVPAGFRQIITQWTITVSANGVVSGNGLLNGVIRITNAPTHENPPGPPNRDVPQPPSDIQYELDDMDVPLFGPMPQTGFLSDNITYIIILGVSGLVIAGYFTIRAAQKKKNASKKG